MIAIPTMHGILKSLTPTAAAATDPYWSLTTCLLHFDGTNGQTTGFVDDGPNNLTVSGSAGASYTTTSPKFGASCTSTFATKQAISAGTVASSYISASQDFTIECYFKRGNTANYSEFLTTYATTNGFRIIIDPNADINNPSLRFFYFPSVANFVSAGNNKFQDGNWHHLAIVRSGTGTNNTKGYLDGTSIAQCSSNASVTADVPFRVGSRAQADNNPSTLNVDECRFTLAARYTGSFTPGGPFSQTTWQ